MSKIKYGLQLSRRTAVYLTYRYRDLSISMVAICSFLIGNETGCINCSFQTKMRAKEKEREKEREKVTMKKKKRFEKKEAINRTELKMNEKKNPIASIIMQQY